MIRSAGLRIAGLVVVAVMATSAVGGASTPGTTAYTPNDVVVYSVADGATSTTSTGGTKTAGDVTLDEFAPDTDGSTDSVVSALTFPDSTASDTSAEHALTASGTATSEGELTLAADGSCLLATGYDASAGTKKVASTPSSGSGAVPRTVAEVYPDGSFDTSTALTDFANENNPRSAAAATCGGDAPIYLGGAGNTLGDATGGVQITTLGATTSTELTDPSSYDNVRQVQVVDGQLYTSADPDVKSNSASVSIAEVGNGLPSASDTGLEPTNLDFADEPGTTTSEAPVEPYGYALLQINPDSSGVDTLYVADAGLTPAGGTSPGAIVKYYLDPQNGEWTEEGAVSLPNVIGLTAQDVDDSGTVDIYATTSDGGNAFSSTTGDSISDGGLWELTDASGFGEPLTGTPQEIYAAPVGTELRGVAFAPGTDIGSGGGTGNGAGAAISFSSSADGLPATLGDPTNPTLTITVTDTDPDGGDPTLTPTSSSDTTVVPLNGISLSEAGTGQWTLSVTPNAVGTSTITVTANDSDGNTATYQIAYGVSAATESGDRYYSGAGNASTEISVGDGYFIAGDDLTNTLHLYDSATSGPPVNSWNFDSQLPDGSQSIDIEAAAEMPDEDSGDRIIYWLGSQSAATTSGQTPPAPDTLFATEVTGSGASTELTYLGSYMGLREDLIDWDDDNGSPLGLSYAGGQSVKSWQGLDVEGLEFAPSSTTTAYLAFRAPTDEPYESGDGFDALLVPVTNLPSLIGNEPTATGLAKFGAPIEMNLGGLGIRELRKNAANQYLIIAGTSDSSDSDFQLYTWDGEPADAPALTGTALPSVADGAWEGIVADPADPLGPGSTVELIEDNGDTDWYGDGLTANSGLLDGLQKDLGRTFTISTLQTQTITYTSRAPTAATVRGTYAPTAKASSGLTVSFSVDPTSDPGACLVSGGVVTFTGAGRCVIDATQAGNGSWAPAPTGIQAFEVAASLGSKTAKPSVVLESGTLSVQAGTDGLSIPVRCRSASCSGTLTLSIAVRVKVHGKITTRRRTIATGSYKIAAGARRSVTIRLDKTGRALTVGSVKAWLVASVKGGTKTTVVVTLRTTDSGAARA